VTVEAELTVKPSGWVRNALRSRKVLAGLGIIVFFIGLAVIGPLFVSDPSATSPLAYGHPSDAHWLGTTDTGQDVLAQLVDGSRVSLIVGFVAAAISTLVAVAIGLSSAFLGGIWDEVLSTITNVFLVLPALPLAIVLAGYLHGAGTLAISVVISVTAWPWSARILRAQTLSMRRRDYIQAARLIGESTPRIIWSEIVPNEIPLIAAQFLTTVLYAILIQAGLAFLGVGSVTTWSWGTMLYWAQNASALSANAWWWFVPPGLCLALLGTGLALMNFGVDEGANPRLGGRTRQRRWTRGSTLPPQIASNLDVPSAPGVEVGSSS
jgi:peptide/nickel transport system permease protein